MVDRVDFEGASLKGAIFQNTVLTSTSFQGADVTGADFTEAYLGDFDLKKLCKNPTLTGESREAKGGRSLPRPNAPAVRRSPTTRHLRRHLSTRGDCEW